MGHDRTLFTCVLTCAVNGDKLKQMIIFKRKTLPKDDFPKDVVFCVNEKGWTCKTIIQKRFQKIVERDLSFNLKDY